MWKFQDISATQNLREINFGHFEAPIIVILSARGARALIHLAFIHHHHHVGPFCQIHY